MNALVEDFRVGYSRMYSKPQFAANISAYARTLESTLDVRNRVRIFKLVEEFIDHTQRLQIEDPSGNITSWQR